MQGGWQPPPGGGQGYGPPGSGGFGQPAPPQGYGAPPPSMSFQQPYQGGAPGGMMGASYGNYEFNDTENAIIDKAASRAKLWGIISTVIGALQCVSSCFAVIPNNLGLATNLPIGIVAIVVGITFIGVGNSLKMVVQTQGNDLAHMMQALDKMSGAFMVQIVCAILGFVLALLGFLILAFVAIAVAASS